MDRSKSFAEMATYLRSIRPSNDYVQFDRIVRLVLFWYDTHRIKEPQVFLEQEGKEYQAFMAYLTSELGHQPVLTKDFVGSMLKFSRETR
jgi:hypothetical protein